MRQETMETTRTGVTGSVDNRPDVDDGTALPWESPGSGSGPAELANDRLETEIIELVGHLSTATYDLLVSIGELDDRGTYLLSGALSCAAWLADRCDIERVTAHNQVRVARAMRTFPALDAAMAAGDVSYARARMLVAHLSTGHVDELVDPDEAVTTSALI
jgi:hypothetical protein